MLEQTRLSYEFDRYQLDAGDRLLYRNGEPVPLPPKVIDTLLVLVERHGRVVEKAVLFATVWPDVAVEENNLTQNVSLLRKTLAAGDDRKFIETIPRRGYRFVAPVKIVEEAPGAPPVTHVQRPRWRLGAALSILALLAGAALAWHGMRPPASGPAFRQLTTNSSELPVLFGAISPDGNSLAYVDGAGHHLKSIRTGETRLLPVPPEASGLAVRWFADGAKLLLSTGSPQDAGRGIWTFSLHDNTAQRISNGGTQAAPSPDGSRICYLGADGLELWLAAASGQSPQRVLSVNRGTLAVPVWTPSGDRIAYAYPHSGPPDASGKTALQVDVGSVDLQGQQETRRPFDIAITGGALLPSGRFLYALRRAPFSDWGKACSGSRSTIADFGNPTGGRAAWPYWARGPRPSTSAPPATGESWCSSKANHKAMSTSRNWPTTERI
jgi:DNA-binding winged helix-turn-helix (wHTH) protein